MKCEFCKKTGKYLSVNVEIGKTVPEKFDNFEVILSFNVGSYNFPDEVIKCPDCGNFYIKRRRIDNEINNPSDEIYFEELTTEQVQEYLERVK